MKYDVSFMNMHNALFMQGSNLGDKINVAAKGAKVCWDDDRQVLFITFKGKTTTIPFTSTQSFDLIEVPEDVKEWAGIAETTQTNAPFARKKVEPTDITVTDDMSEAEAHRARVRATSANSNRAQPTVQNDDLINQSRALAMGVKHNKTAQVSNAQHVGEMAAVTGKPKALSHAAMKAQVAQEMKEGQ